MQPEDISNRCEQNFNFSNKLDSLNQLNKSENFNQINKFENINKFEVFESYQENKVTLAQHIQESINRPHIKYKSIDIPPLHIQSIKLNKPVMKLNEISFNQGNYILPRTFEFSARMKLPSGIRNQEKKIIKYKII